MSPLELSVVQESSFRSLQSPCRVHGSCAGVWGVPGLGGKGATAQVMCAESSRSLVVLVEVT